MANGVQQAVVGFRQFTLHKVTANTPEAYTTGEKIFIEGAQSLTRSESATDINIPADDGTYYSGHRVDYNDYQVQLTELPIEIEAMLGGHTFDEENNMFTVSDTDEAPYFAIGYAGLKMDGNYRMITHFVGKLMSISYDLNTVGNGEDYTPYTLTFRDEKRKADGAWRQQKDSTDGTFAWLDTVAQYPDTTETP